MTSKEYFDYLKERINDVRKVAKLGTFVTFTGICPLLERLSWTTQFNDIKIRKEGRIIGEDFKKFVDNYLVKANPLYKNTSSTELYGHLRCAVVHCLSLHNSIGDIDSKFALAHRHDSQIAKGITSHLKIYKGKTILVAEDFLDDLEKVLEIIWKDQNVNANFLLCANAVPPLGHEFYENRVIRIETPAVTGVNLPTDYESLKIETEIPSGIPVKVTT